MLQPGPRLVTHDAVTGRLHQIQTTDEDGDITVGAVAVATMAPSRLMVAVDHLDGQNPALGCKNTANTPPNQHIKAMTNLDSHQDHRIETEASVNHSGVDQGVRTEALMVVQVSNHTRLQQCHPKTSDSRTLNRLSHHSMRLPSRRHRANSRYQCRPLGSHHHLHRNSRELVLSSHPLPHQTTQARGLLRLQI